VSGTTILRDTVGDAEVVTQMAPEGDRWISVVSGGAMDGYVSVMDLKGDQAVLHAAVVEHVTGSAEQP